MHSQGPLQALLRDGKLELQQVHVQGTNMDFVAGGTIDLLHGYALRLHSEGTINAALASVMNKDDSIFGSGEICGERARNRTISRICRGAPS